MTRSTKDVPTVDKSHSHSAPEQTSNYPEYVMRRLLYVGRYFDLFLPGYKRSITKERKRYEQRWPGINAHALAIIGKERETAERKG